MKILITGGKSATALKLLKAFAQHQVILADYGDMPTFSSAAYRFISLGEKNEDILAHVLLNSCLDEKVDVILPIHQFELEPVIKATVLFEEFGVKVLLPTIEKLAMYLYAEKMEHWAIFNKGNLIFSTLPEQNLEFLGRQADLNGAYYLNNSNADFKLRLITI